MSFDIQTKHEVSPRVDFMRTDGFALYTDVNLQMVEELQNSPIKKAEAHPEHRFKQYNLEPAVAGLYIASHQLMAGLPRYSGPAFHEAYGVTSEDLMAVHGKQLFNEGFGDINFTWHFAPALAVAVVRQFASDGLIAHEDIERLTLNDWANVIGSGWFSKLVHSMAFTRNGVYRQFGVGSDDYGSNKLRLTLAQGTGQPVHFRILDTDMAVEPHENNREYLIARITPALQSLLRKQMHDKTADSTGCPVARRALRLSHLRSDSNSHLLHMIETGAMSLKSQNEEIRTYEQEYTAIDRTLALIADQLDEYERMYGVPVYDRRTLTLQHERLEPSRILYSA